MNRTISIGKMGMGMIWSISPPKTPAAHTICSQFIGFYNFFSPSISPKCCVTCKLKWQQLHEEPLHWQKEIKSVKGLGKDNLLLLSNCPEGIVSALCSPYYHFVDCGLSSVTNQKWLDNLSLPQQCKNSLRLAMKYWPIPKSVSFKSRYGVLRLFKIDSQPLDCFCSPTQCQSPSHSASNVSVIVCDRFWETVQYSARQSGCCLTTYG